MIDLKRIFKQLQTAFEGLITGDKPSYTWHGPSVLQLLDDITANQADARPCAGSHTIWELVRHIAVWEDQAQKCLDGEKFRWLTNEDEWSIVQNTSEKAWQQTIDELKSSHQYLLETLSRFDGTQLDLIVPSEPSVPAPWSTTSFHTLLIGIIQHAAYHAGQIAILKKG